MMIIEKETTEIHGKVVGAVNLGETPSGSRSNVSAEWALSGKGISASMKTTDYLLTRPDGISIINSIGVATTRDNELIAVNLGGYGLIPTGGLMKLKGFITYETSSKKYSDFNSRIDMFEGEFVIATGEITLSGRELKV